ncbi:hypothetical protein O3P69_006735 [Scylla paramamosain]|uniref:Uncharacterized protein n=1 Tax=Scylla paramamosain TaxID=85552 RepID=A0AAW0U477_SCYPA
MDQAGRGERKGKKWGVEVVVVEEEEEGHLSSFLPSLESLSPASHRGLDSRVHLLCVPPPPRVTKSEESSVT